jgi:chitin disaccharide deacetylase
VALHDHSPARVLIVNADDFGRSHGINAGVIKSYEQGIVTSAGLMVRWPPAAEAAEYARREAGLSVGLHVDLGEWTHEPDGWVAVYETVALDDEAAIEREIRSQIDSFRELVGAGPTHLDSHQHLHSNGGPIGDALGRIAAELGVPLRGFGGEVRYCGDFYGQNERGVPHPEVIRPENLIALIRALPAGITELGCHPALADDSGSPYRHERELEVATLCDPRVRAAIDEEGIALRSFAAIASSARTA